MNNAEKLMNYKYHNEIIYYNKSLQKGLVTFFSNSLSNKLNIYSYYLQNAQMANIRVVPGCKTRSTKSGSGRKILKQKHSGNARQGTNRAPQRKGSGKAHGPSSKKNYIQKINKRAMAKTLITYLMSPSKFFVIDDLSSFNHISESEKFFQSFDRKVLLIFETTDNLRYIANVDKKILQYTCVNL